LIKNRDDEPHRKQKNLGARKSCNKSERNRDLLSIGACQKKEKKTSEQKGKKKNYFVRRGRNPSRRGNEGRQHNTKRGDRNGSANKKRVG